MKIKLADFFAMITQLFHSRVPWGRGPSKLLNASFPSDAPRSKGKRLLRRCSGRTVWGVLGFLVLFTILVVMVSKWVLLPGLLKAQHATHEQRRKMAADSLLLLSVMLTILIVGLLLTFRISRFFFPRRSDLRSRTKVVDAWAEAGKRMENDQDKQE